MDECPQDDHNELSILNNNLGIAYKKMGKVDDAIVYFSESIK